MGVRDLWQALEPVARKVHLDELKGQTIAVDLSGWIVESQQMQAAHTVKHMYLKNLFCRCSKLLSYGIKLVFVLEGKAPDVKGDTLSQRHQATFPEKLHTRVTGNRPRLQALNRECERLLNTLGLQCVQGSGEGEATCAFLNRSKLVDGCMTEDSDAFLYGATVVYRSIEIGDKDPHVIAYRMEDIESKLGLTRQRLIALALLTGCDYYPGVYGVGKETAIKLLAKLGDIDVLDRFRSWRKDSKFKDLQTKADNIMRKPRHCSTCHHPGSPKEHAANGCTCCKTDQDCTKSIEKDVECPCPWHETDSVKQQWKMELEVRKKALATKGFPPEEVIQEFLRDADGVELPSSEWRMPVLPDFQDFMQVNLFWEASKSFEKLFPLLARWHLLHKHSVNGNSALKPEKIIKLRNRQNVALYEVEWSQEGVITVADDKTEVACLRTVEPQQLFKECYPDLVDQFLKELNAKKLTKKTKDSKDIREFFRVTAKAQVQTPALELVTASNGTKCEIEQNQLPLREEKSKKGLEQQARPRRAERAKPTTRVRKQRAKAVPESATPITGFFESKTQNDRSTDDSSLAAYDVPLAERIRKKAVEPSAECEVEQQVRPIVGLSSLEISVSDSPETVPRSPVRASRGEVLAANDCSPPKRKHVSTPSSALTRSHISVSDSLVSEEAGASEGSCGTPEDGKMTRIRKPARQLFPSLPEMCVIGTPVADEEEICTLRTPSALASVTQSTPICAASQVMNVDGDDYDPSKSLFTSPSLNDPSCTSQIDCKPHSVIVISDGEA